MPRAKNRLALHIALIVSSGFATEVFAVPAQDLLITTPDQGGVVLSGTDKLTITSTGGITSSAKAVSFKGTTSGAGVIVDNSGTIKSTGGRAFDSSGDETLPRNYSITNRAGGVITSTDDAIRIDSNFPSGSILIDNSGTIRSTSEGQGIDLDAVRGAGVTTTIINREGGLIRGDFSDGMKTGSNATITNYGEISSEDSTTADQKFDGIDIDSATGVTINNYGLISGGRHGITTDLGATLINYSTGIIIGRNGSGYGSDGNGTVINYGTITGSNNGLQPNGDGDGVDIDLIAHIENYGIIKGLGASGVDKGGSANGSEGIAAGGGYIYNATNALISSVDSAILVDDGSGGSGAGATTLINYGTIEGLNGFGVKLVGEFDDSVFNNGLISGSNGLALDFGGGNDTLTLGHNSRFVGRVDGGTGTDTVIMDDTLGGSFGASQNFESLQVRQGTWTLTGSGDFSSGGSVSSGAELINQGGIAGSMTVDQGGVFAGGGTVGGLDVNGTLLSSKALGAAQVNGNLNMSSGSTLVFGTDAGGAVINVSGNANLNGASLVTSASAGTHPWQNQYTVLQASSISGTFGSVTSNYAFLTPTLSYEPTSVDLTYTRNGVAFKDYASTGNGSHAATSLASMGNNNALYNALLNTSTATAGSAIEQLAGASNANLTSATLASTSQVGATMMSAMQGMSSGSSLLVGMDDKDTPALAATGVPDAARNLNDPNARGRVWLQGIGSYGKLDGEHGSAGLEQRTKGSVLGVDWSLSPAWRMGVLGGYSRTDLDSTGVDGKVNSWHVGAYAQRQSGPLALRLGAAYSHHDGESKRTVDFDGFSDRPKGDYDADSQQAFVELGYAMGSGHLNVEPFANLGYQRYHRDSYTEKGGAAALSVEDQSQDNFSSTFGVRLAQLTQLQNGMSLTPRGSLGWRHTYGDVDSSTRQAFVLGGSAFSVEGTALDRDSLMVEAGLDLGISAHHTLSLGYNGELGSNSRNHALMGQWQMSF
jgi:outer membrane autotransporter protein